MHTHITANLEIAFIPYSTAIEKQTPIHIKMKMVSPLLLSIINISSTAFDIKGVAKEKVVAVPARSPTTARISISLPTIPSVFFNTDPQAVAKDFLFFFSQKNGKHRLLPEVYRTTMVLAPNEIKDM